MKNKIDAVNEFHKTFKIGEAPNKPTIIDYKDYQLRHDLMKEENEEYYEACLDGDMVEIADALGDQLYILCGTILKHGLQYKIDEVFNEIHGSNMSKLDKEGKPIFREDGKILKGENYFKPNIKLILDEQ
jgi:predicted HAD superfamily Cof-like phosphohydrolase